MPFINRPGLTAHKKSYADALKENKIHSKIKKKSPSKDLETNTQAKRANTFEKTPVEKSKTKTEKLFP